MLKIHDEGVLTAPIPPGGPNGPGRAREAEGIHVEDILCRLSFLMVVLLN